MRDTTARKRNTFNNCFAPRDAARPYNRDPSPARPRGRISISIRRPPEKRPH
ncbi:conserved hypothetical protein [Burkholderia pseudomallei Pakistan 9]|nr:conserved hypothetical protein [Burkholderia pseudomallei Pakistan 9]